MGSNGMDAARVTGSGNATVITFEPQVIHGGPSRPVAAEAPSVDRSGLAPLSRAGQRTLDNLYTLRLNLEQNNALAASHNDAQKVDRNNVLIRKVDEAIASFNGTGDVRAIERNGADKLSQLGGLADFLGIMDTINVNPPAGSSNVAPSSGSSAAPAAPSSASVNTTQRRLAREQAADFASMRSLGFEVGTPQRPNRAEIRRFQEFANAATGAGLDTDGRFGNDTHLAVRDLVRGIQAGLAAANHDPGRIDGVWGKDSQAALDAHIGNGTCNKPSLAVVRALLANQASAA